MSNQIAHVLDAKWRSDDVITNEEKGFSFLNLDERILAGLSKAGYKIPSPVQLEAIPLCLTGNDVFVQGKAGTGKTLVFSVLALTKVLEAEDLQVLIVAPTREGAFQIYNTINVIGSEVKNLKCEFFIGGFSFVDDLPKAEECNIAVGTPGRISHLIHEEKLNIDTIRLFIIDDIDELLNKHMRPEVTDIFSTLPVKIQTVVTSLTCTEEVLQLASEYLEYPYLACYCENEHLPLLGMAHYYHIVPVDYMPVLSYRKKLEVLRDILLKVKFSQCIIFCNSVYRVELLCVDIQNCGLPVASMTKAMDQLERLQALELLKENKCKVFISTDVGSRGLDAENVDLVVNFDMPHDSRAYLHRCGRAGRYGTECSSITFLMESQKAILFEIEKEGQFKSYALPEHIPQDFNCHINSNKVGSLPCNSEKIIVTSLAELSKNAIFNLDKKEVGGRCSLLTTNEFEETTNSEIDTNYLMPVSEAIKQENEFAEDSQDTTTCLHHSGKENIGIIEIFTADQLNIDIENTKVFNNKHDSEHFAASSLKTAHAFSRNEAESVECEKEKVFGSSDLNVFPDASKIRESNSKHYDSDPLSSECKSLQLNDNWKNPTSSCGETEVEQHLKKTDTGSECGSFEEIDLFSTTRIVPKSTFKFKSPFQSSKNVLEKPFNDMHLEREQNWPEKVARIPHVTKKKKNCNKNIKDMCKKKPSNLANCAHYKGQIKSRERQVMFCGVKTTSTESDTNNSGLKFYSRFPVNYWDKKTACISKCGKCLNGHANHFHTSYFNVQGNSFSDKKFVDRHFNCCNSKLCSSSQHCSFPNYNCQHPYLVHRDMVFKQWKFINDFSYFLSYFIK